MAECSYFGEVKEVGFISTRLAGTDGVSLEAAKWARVFEPKGFDVIELPGYVTGEAVQKTKEFLTDAKRTERAVEHNYNVGKCFFSFDVLERKLKHYIAEHMVLRE